MHDTRTARFRGSTPGFTTFTELKPLSQAALGLTQKRDYP